MKKEKNEPGEGIRSLKTSSLFRFINFELYVKPNIIVMTIGLCAMAGSLGYIIYMRKKYEGMGFYAAVNEDGSETFVKKRTRWD